MTAEGNKFIENHTDENIKGKEMKIVRWIDGGKMIVVSSSYKTSLNCMKHLLSAVYKRAGFMSFCLKL